MWSTLINAIKELTKDRKRFKKEERTALGELFETTSNLLIEVINYFEKDEYPQMISGTLETLGKNIEKYLTKTIKNKKRDEILEYFKPFESLKDEWEQRNEPGSLDNLRYAAGEFKGLAILFKT
jgi:hypothetical protein